MDRPDWNALAALPLAQWAPRNQARVRATEVRRAAAPVVDIHNHLGRWLSGGQWMIPDVHALIAVMDEVGVETIVNLDGMWDDELTDNLQRYDEAFPGRFATFCQLDWSRITAPGGVDELTTSLAESARRGARGLKVWKNLGLTVRDDDGSVVLPDDPRVIEVIARAGDLGLPVLIHTADPIAFFAPADAHNERLDELRQVPDWWFGDTDRYPTFDRLLDAHAALVLACPSTRFIGAHAGCAAEDLDRVEALIEATPNYTIDIAGRMAELGRQPRRFKSLVEQHPDRVLFGTDVYPATADAYRLFFRFVETADECFTYDPEGDIPSQGRWDVSALDLDTRVLDAVYRTNARLLLGA